jgi:hypothetical protein
MVAPSVFQGSQTGVRTEIWVPIMMEAQLNPLGDLLHDHHEFWLLAFGRFKPGVVLEQAQEEMWNCDAAMRKHGRAATNSWPAVSTPSLPMKFTTDPSHKATA